MEDHKFLTAFDHFGQLLQIKEFPMAHTLETPVISMIASGQGVDREGQVTDIIIHTYFDKESVREIIEAFKSALDHLTDIDELKKKTP